MPTVRRGGAMAAALLARLGVAAADAAMVGDRLGTDIAMGQAAGMAGILVLTGATSPAALAGAGVRPDYVVAGLHQLVRGLPHCDQRIR